VGVQGRSIALLMMWHRVCDEIMRKVDRVKFSGGTRLGTVLDSKIVQPLVIQKAKNDKFKRPLIAVIITDGEVSLPIFNSSRGRGCTSISGNYS
jgi:hypothetical protein